MKQRKILKLLSIPVGIIALLLVGAEFANQLVVNVVVNGVRHPLYGVLVLFAVIAVVGAFPLGAYLWVRSLPSQAGDKLLDPYFRWLNEGPSRAERQQAAGTAPESPVSRLRPWYAVVAAGLAVAAAAGAAYATSPRSHPVPAADVAGHYGACSPAPCVTEHGVTLYVTSVSPRYHPTDLTAGERGFSDGGQAPAGYRFVRILVRFAVPAGTAMPDARRSIVLLDGKAQLRPTALAFDPACRAVVASTVAEQVVPLCYLAALRTAAPLRLGFLPWKVSIRV